MKQPPAAALTVCLLGGFRVEGEDGAVGSAIWQRRRGARSLVKLLALAPRQSLQRDQIIEMLWPGRDPASGETALRKAIHYARHAFEPHLASGRESRFLTLDGETVRLVNVLVDADVFQRKGRAALAATDRHAIEAVLAAYAGDLLPEDRYADWTAVARDQAADLGIALRLRLADVLSSQGERDAAAAHLRDVLAIDATREDVHRRLIALYLESGDRAAAQRQYDSCRRILDEELGVEPQPETVAMGDVISVQRNEPYRPAALERPDLAPLVGRERARGLLLDAVRQPDGAVVLVGGEAGIGKTRLVTDVATAASEEGAIVLWGAAYEHEGLMPYGAIVEAFEGYLRTQDDGDREALGHLAGDLAPLLPSLPQSDSSVPDRYRVHVAVLRFLEEISVSRPLVLVLDDLHVADADTLQLFAFLARQVPRTRVTILATYREEDVRVGGPLDRTRTALTRAGLIHRVDLGYLSGTEAVELAGAVLPGPIESSLLEYLHATSLGNPLFLEELILTLRSTERIARRGGRWTLQEAAPEIPAVIDSLIQSRSSALGPDAVRLLGVIAAQGGGVDYDLLAATAILPEASLLGALDQTVEARIIEEEGGVYRFRHPLFQSAIYNTLRMHRRTQAHELLARVLEERRPGEIEALAYHWSQSGDRAHAARYLELAGDRAAIVPALETAIEHYRAAIERTTDRQAPLGEKLGRMYYRQARYDESLETLEGAMAMYRHDGDDEGTLRATAAMARVYRYQGLSDTGLALIADVSPELLPPSPAALAVRLVLVDLYFITGRYEDARDAAEHAADMARALNDRRALGEAEERRGTALNILGQVQEGILVIENALTWLEDAGDHETLARAHYNLATAFYHIGHMARVRDDARRAIEITERYGRPDALCYYLFGLASAEIILGDWRAARANLERARDVGDRVGESAETIGIPLYLGQLSLLEGDPESAVAFLNEGLTRAREARNRQLEETGILFLAELALNQGRPDEAIEFLIPLAGKNATIPIDPTLARAYLATGDTERAEQTATTAVKACRDQPGPYLVDSLWALALIASRRGVPDGSAIRDGLELARRLPYPLGEARLLEVEARLTGRDDLLRQAERIYSRLGQSGEGMSFATSG